MGGNIGVLVELGLSEGIDANNESVKILAKDLAMQIAASQPQFVKREDADAKSIEEERSIYRQQALDSGKPENIVDKIVDGRINKWFGEVCLLEQVWIKDTDVKINKLLAKVSQSSAEKSRSIVSIVSKLEKVSKSVRTISQPKLRK